MYTFFIYLYCFAIWLAAPFNGKARQWVRGRRNWRERYRQAFQSKGKVLWVHAASLGEFEQGRPVMEAFRQQHPDWQLVLTFFSPSGYEIRKNYPTADFVCYLPLDTPRQAREFIALIQPDIAVFVKYEFWANYLSILKTRGIPTLLVSGLFRSSQPFFRPWGGFWRRMLGCFTHFFVQNETSQQLLSQIGFQNSTLTGDTRIDRVLQLAQQAPENETVRRFAQGARVLIAGSSWEADEQVLHTWFTFHAGAAYKCILAPHEPSEPHVLRLMAAFGNIPVVRYSQATPDTLQAARVLLIDNIGMLNTLYRYAQVAYIGGGFGKGIHNTLEPAAFGLPVLFGPRYEKFEEARAFVERGGAFPVRDAAALTVALQQLEDPVFHQRASVAVSGYLEQQRGATGKVLGFISDKGLA